MPRKSKKKSKMTFAQKVFKRVGDRTKKFSKKALDREEMDALYGIRHVVSTGLPSLDLNCFCIINEECEKEWGIPTGRFVEFHGESESGKTLLANTIFARCMKQGGFSMKATSERDYDIRWDDEVFLREGVPKEVFNTSCRFNTCSNVSEMKYAFENFAATIRETLEEDAKERGEEYNGDGPPCCFVVDSVAEILGDDDFKALSQSAVSETNHRADRLKEDGVLEDSIRPGNHAFHFKKFFKVANEDVNKYNILFLMVNQTRSNIQTGGPMFGPKTKPAHDATMKFISSLRLKMVRWSPSTKHKKSLHNKKYITGFPVQVKIEKLRQKTVGDGTVMLFQRADSSFDYLYSLIDSFGITGLALQVGSNYETAKWKFKHDRFEDLDIRFREELTPFFDKFHNKKTDEIREYLVKNLEVTAMLDYTVRQLGPYRPDFDQVQTMVDVKEAKDEIFDEDNDSLGDENE
tara:strand:+ start:52698 stop:54086 length:1389 start_codon:yes stop_codon:yes gene_type:complete